MKSTPIGVCINFFYKTIISNKSTQFFTLIKGVQLIGMPKDIVDRGCAVIESIDVWGEDLKIILTSLGIYGEYGDNEERICEEYMTRVRKMVSEGKSVDDVIAYLSHNVLGPMRFPPPKTAKDGS